MTRLMKITLATALALSGLTATVADAGNARLNLERATAAGIATVEPTYRRGQITSPVFAPPGYMAPKMKFNCYVAGFVAQLSRSLRITNPYNFTVPAGTVAEYTAPLGVNGTVALPALKPHEDYFVQSVLPHPMWAGTACTATEV